MADIIKSRIAETTTSTGTGDIALAGAVTAHKPFSSACSIADTVDIVIYAVDANSVPTGDWEECAATYSGADTLTRTTFKDSSTGAPVSFAAGTKIVIHSPNAGRLAMLKNAGATGQFLAKGSGSDFDVAWSSIESLTHAATAKTAPDDADESPWTDSAAGFALVKRTWGNIKSTLATYFSSLYLAIGNLSWDATDGLVQRRGVNPQSLALTNTYTDPSTWERGGMRWASNIFRIGTEKLGAGTGRNVYIDTYDSITFWNTQYGYSMGSVSGGFWGFNNAGPLANDSCVLGGNGSNAGSGWKTFAMASGTTATVGAVTMNKSAGRINVASAATSVVVTNSRVSAASHIFATITTNDTTAQIKNIVPAAGLFTVNLVAPTAQIELDFFVVQFGS